MKILVPIHTAGWGDEALCGGVLEARHQGGEAPALSAVVARQEEQVFAAGRLILSWRL